MISDDDIDKAVEYLTKSAGEAARSRAHRVYIEEYRKTLKATIMAEYPDHSIGAQERFAYADPRYLQLLEGLREAVENDERHRFLRAAAEAKIEAWRTYSATIRALKI